MSSWIGFSTEKDNESIPDLFADYTQIDFSNFGKVLMLDEKMFPGFTESEITVIAQTLGLQPFTQYVILNDEEVMTLWKALKLGGDQAELLLQCEDALEKGKKAVLKEHNLRVASTTLNWILLPVCGITIGVIIYLIRHPVRKD